LLHLRKTLTEVPQLRVRFYIAWVKSARRSLGARRTPQKLVLESLRGCIVPGSRPGQRGKCSMATPVSICRTAALRTFCLILWMDEFLAGTVGRRR
jgi:hypothetical protein